MYTFGLGCLCRRYRTASLVPLRNWLNPSVSDPSLQQACRGIGSLIRNELILGKSEDRSNTDWVRQSALSPYTVARVRNLPPESPPSAPVSQVRLCSSVMGVVLQIHHQGSQSFTDCFLQPCCRMTHLTEFQIQSLLFQLCPVDEMGQIFSHLATGMAMFLVSTAALDKGDDCAQVHWTGDTDWGIP